MRETLSPTRPNENEHMLWWYISKNVLQNPAIQLQKERLLLGFWWVQCF